jgi:hypothetical protein
MTHNRKLVIGGAALVKARLKNTGPAMVSICDELEKVLAASEFFANAPFGWISMIIRYGLKNEFEPCLPKDQQEAWRLACVHRSGRASVDLG